MTEIKSSGISKHSRRGIKQLLLLVGMMILCVIMNVIVGGNLLTLSNFGIICCHAVFPALVAWCMMFIYSTGNIDLSLGASMLLSGSLGIILLGKYHIGYVGFVICTLAGCVLMQLLSLAVSELAKLPAWIAGLGMAMLYEAVLSIYVSEMSKTSGSASILIPSEYSFFGTTTGMVSLLFFGLALAWLLFNKTSLGIHVLAIGSNSGVAQSLGISRRKTVFLAAIVGGILLGLSAIAYVSYSGLLYAKSGLTSISLIFKALAAYLLADCVVSIVTLPIGILFGSLFVEIIFNFMAMLGVPAGTGQNVGLGLIVILFGVVSSVNKKGVVK